jgi:hypothetical protein
MTAVPERVVLVGAPIVKPPDIYTETGWSQFETVMRTAALEEPCVWCQLEGHVVRWRFSPNPADVTPPGVLDEEVEGCHCCIWGRRGVEGLVARADRESFNGREVKVEHLELDGSWKPWKRWF